MGLLLTVDGVVTAAEDFEFSNVDPGGCESCSFDLPGGAIPSAGARVQVTDGGTIVWDGYVDASGERQTEGRISGAGQAVGMAALLDDQPFGMVYRDCALSPWTAPPSVQRQIDLAGLAAGYIEGDQGSVEVIRDDATLRPALVLKFTNMITSAGRHPIIEGWYDAGAGNLIGRFKATYRTYSKADGGLNTLAGNWFNQAVLSGDDTPGVVTASGDLGSSGTIDLVADGARRYAYVQLYYNAVVATGAGDWRWMLDNMAVYGDHGLSLATGTGGEGLYPGDVAADALKRSGAAITFGTVETGAPFVIRQLAYKDQPVSGASVIGDAAKLAAFHWGVWPPGMVDSRPRLDFLARPASATAAVRRAECGSLEIEERVSAMYDEIEARYTDPAGGPGTVTVTKTNARLPVGRSRRKVVDVGSATLASATALASYLLGLDQSQTRGSGPVTLPSAVASAGGGRRAAHLLKAGQDRLRVLDLRVSGLLLTEQNTFRIARVSVSVKAGQPITTVEIDQGADLLETLNARLAELEAIVGT